MVSSNTSFGKLREVIVGRELNLPKRLADVSFKYFYKEALGQAMYSSTFGDYEVNAEILQARREQLDGLAKLLESLGIVVYRPEEVTKLAKFKTPTFESEQSSASNVRDLALVYRDWIVETPMFIRNRYFENLNLYDVFAHATRGGLEGKWVKAPLTKLIPSRMDLEDWHLDRDYSRDLSGYDMAIDAAQFLRIGRDVVVNVATFNQWLGFQWVKSLFPESTFHVIKSNDNHIDGELVCLKPGVFLASPRFKAYRDQLPRKFQTWKFIYPDNLTADIDIRGMTSADIRLASSRGMDINVLSIDESRVVVNKRAIGVKDALEKNGFEVIEAQLDYGEVFAGGIHCSTLDLVREDEYAFYA